MPTPIGPYAEDIDIGVLKGRAGARVYHSANQSIPNDTITTLAFDSEDYDTDDIHDTVTNNSRLTCKTAGKYLIAACIPYSTNGTGYRGAWIDLNGSVTLTLARIPAVTSSGIGTYVFIMTVYDLSVNDYVVLKAKQDSGGALDVLVNGLFFAMQRVG